MTIKEAENFYKQDCRSYEIGKNKEFLTWYQSSIKDGYYCFMEPDALQSLIDTIANWYEIKYPERDFKEKIPSSFTDTPSLAEAMTIKQLMYRLSNNEVALLNCNYRAKGHGSSPIYKNNKVISWESHIFMRISKKAVGEEDYLYGKNPYFLVFADQTTGKLGNYPNDELKECVDCESNITLDELLEILREKYTDILDFSELEECICDHNGDMELRHRILQLVALKLLYSRNTTPEHGYKRADMFLKEFSEEFNLDLSFDEINEIIGRNYKGEVPPVQEDFQPTVEQSKESRGLIASVLMKRFPKKSRGSKEKQQ